METLNYKNGLFTGNITLTKQADTKVTLNTLNKYMPGNVELTLQAQEATPTFDGGEITDTAASIEVDNAEISTTTNSSHVTITPLAQSARTSVNYNGAVNGWVTAADNTTIIEADNEEWSGSTYYLNGVTLPASSTFTVTVPMYSKSLVGYATIDQSTIGSVVTYTFTVDSEGYVTVTDDWPIIQ